MELKRNQMVVFENGYKAGWLEATWSEKKNAFCIRTDEIDPETGRYIILYSTEIIEKQNRKPLAKFVPSRKNCPVMIRPIGQTEKAYQLEDGSNGLIGRGCKVYYKYVAKSVCFIDENGDIYAPVWAL